MRISIIMTKIKTMSLKIYSSFHNSESLNMWDLISKTLD